LYLQAAKNILQVPIRIFGDSVLRFSINSDDPAYFGGVILNNHFAVQDLTIEGKSTHVSHGTRYMATGLMKPAIWSLVWMLDEGIKK